MNLTYQKDPYVLMMHSLRVEVLPAFMSMQNEGETCVMS